MFDQLADSPVALVTGVIRSDDTRRGNIGGLAVLGNELLVVRSSFLLQRTGNIEVYDATTFTLRRQIVINGVSSSSILNGITASAADKCLYLAQIDSCCYAAFIRRVDMSDITNDVATKSVTWELKRKQPNGLSVTSRNNLLVACCGSCSLKARIVEYTKLGERVRKIRIQSILFLQHALQLSDDQFLLSNGYGPGGQHQVCIVDGNGQVLHSYGDKRGAATGQLCSPGHLSVDKDGFVYVADTYNDRIVVLDSSLKWSRDLLVPVSCPRALYMDESRELLIIGESDQYKQGIYPPNNSKIIVVKVS